MLLRIRITDNVLDLKDWPERELTVADDGTVVSVKDTKPGVYSWEHAPALGWSVDMIARWLGYDPTGKHPEVYHEAFAFGAWHSSLNRDQLTLWLWRRR